MRYSEIFADFNVPRVPPFGVTPFELHLDLWYQKTIVPACAIVRVVCVILRLAILVQYWLVTDRRRATAYDALALCRAVKNGGRKCRICRRQPGITALPGSPTRFPCTVYSRRQLYATQPAYISAWQWGGTTYLLSPLCFWWSKVNIVWFTRYVLVLWQVPLQPKCDNRIATAVPRDDDRQIADIVALRNALNSINAAAPPAASVGGGNARVMVKDCGSTWTGQSAGSSLASGSKLALKCERYKTELCRTFDENGTCRYGDKCQFAHGAAELRTVARHPKYKTDLCRTFHTTGFCPYGSRCHFIHSLHERHVPVQPSVMPVQAANLVQLPPSVQANSHVVTEKQSLDNLLRILSSVLQANHLDADRTAASLLTRQQEFPSHHTALPQGLSYFSDATSMSTDSASPCPSPTSLNGVSEDLSSSRLYFPVGANAHVLQNAGLQSPVTVPASILTPPGSPASATSSLSSFSSDFDGYDATSSRSVRPALASPMESVHFSRIPEFAHFQLLASKHSLFA